MSTPLKRDRVKYIRDIAKSAYVKKSECYICGSKENLDFHHYSSLTPLLNKWILDNKLSMDTEEEVLALRDRFVSEHMEQLYDEAVTLCHTHHLKLHSIYGKDPLLSTAKKQARWVGIQRDKHNGTNELDTGKT